MKRLATTLGAVIMVIGFWGSVMGQETLIDYPFTGDSPSPTNLKAGLSSTDVSLSSGSISYEVSHSGTWTGSGIPYAQGKSGWAEESSETGKYFTFTISTDGAEEFDLTKVTFLHRATGAGPSAMTVTINGTEISTEDVLDSSTEEYNEVLDLTGLTSAEVRIIGWDNGSRGDDLSGGGDFRIDDVKLEGTVTLSDDPLIVGSPGSLSDFFYAEGNGSSDEQSFTVEGMNLEGDVTISPPASYEISESSGTGYTSSNIILSETDGAVSETPIYVRLKAGLEEDDYNENITISTSNADDVLISLSGFVVETFEIPFSNNLRTQSDYDLAVAQGFEFVDAELSTAAGGRVDISDGYIETPTIDFTEYDKIRVQFDVATFGGGSDRELSVKLSTDDGASYSTLNTFSVTASDPNYDTFFEDIDLTGGNDVSTGKLKFEMTAGSGGIRFRDLTVNLLYENQITDAAGFRLLSSPVSTSFATLLNPIWTQGSANSDYPGDEETDPNILTWDNTSTDGDKANWNAVADLSSTISAGTGFLAYVYTDDVYGEAGTFPKALSVSGTENAVDTEISLNANTNGWTLLGNPFTSSIDFNEINNEDLSGAVYVWNPNDEEGEGGTDENAPGGSWNTYTVGDPGTGDLTDGKIAPFQGFFVQNDGEVTEPSITFGAASKTTGATFYGKTQSAERAVVRLQLEGSGLRNSAWLQFSENGSISEKVRGDAVELESLNGEFALLAAVKYENALMDISHLPIAGDEYSIPLSIQATTGGTFTLSATDFEIPGDVELTFHDYKTGADFTINSDFTYSFELSESANKTMDVPPLKRLQQGPMMAKAANADRFGISVMSRNSVGNENLDSTPKQFALNQNYPNPFNPATVIGYQVPVNSLVTLSVYNVMGQKVATLVDESKSAGNYKVSWDAGSMSSGVYYYRLQSAGQILTRQMTLIK
ncbi:MAG: T9SS type A sorting domain-containing protein [Balneolaceae bacterium]